MAKTCFMGLDIGSISTKGVLLDEDNRILAEAYLWTEGNPVRAVKEVIGRLRLGLPGACVTGVGTTGSARKLIGAMVGADAVKNEITAHAVGTLSVRPDVRTILEIGGQDSKIILLEDGVVTDYAMNTLCAAGTGAFLSAQAARLGVDVEEFGAIALSSRNPSKIAARCTVFAESDLVHKAQTGHKKEDLIAGLCQAVVNNYLNNVGKGKRIRPPVFFQGGVSKNEGVVRAFREALGEEILVDTHSHLLGAVGAALLARKAGRGRIFDFSVTECDFVTTAHECPTCPNHCEILCFYKDGSLLDAWGNRCPNSAVLRDVPAACPRVDSPEKTEAMQAIRNRP